MTYDETIKSVAVSYKSLKGMQPDNLFDIPSIALGVAFSFSKSFIGVINDLNKVIKNND